MSSEIESNEKTIFQKKLKSNFSTNNFNKRKNKIFLDDLKDYSTKELMKKENIFELKLNYNTVFEKFFSNNKKSFSKTLLSNLGEREEDMENIIQIDNFKCYGLPFKINFNKKLKRKYNQNFELEKIKPGHKNYFNLEDIDKEKNSKYELNRKIKKLFFKRKKFKSQKSSLPGKLNAFGDKSSAISMNINKNDSKSRVSNYEKTYITKVNSLSNNINDYISKKNNSIFNYTQHNKLKPIGNPNLFLKNSKSIRSFTLKGDKKLYDLSKNIALDDKSNIKINSKNVYDDILNNKNIDNFNKNNYFSNFITQENTKRNLSQKKQNTLMEMTYKKELKIKEDEIESDKNNKNIIYNDKDNKKDMVNKFKVSIMDLYNYNKNYDKNNNNYFKTESFNESDYSKEDLMKIKNEKINNISKNFTEINKKMKNVINNYNTVMNKMSLTQRIKYNNFKNLRSLSKNTIKNMVSDIDICNNLIQDQIINSIDKLHKIVKPKKNNLYKEIVFEEKLKKEQKLSKNKNINRNNIYISKSLANYENKVLNISGGKLTDLNKNIFLKNNKLDVKSESVKFNFVGKNKIVDRKIIKDNVKSNINILKKLRKENENELTKINNRINEFYRKLEEENNKNSI